MRLSEGRWQEPRTSTGWPEEGTQTVGSQSGRESGLGLRGCPAANTGLGSALPPKEHF